MSARGWPGRPACLRAAARDAERRSEFRGRLRPGRHDEHEALVAPGHGGERATRAQRAPPAVTEVAIELRRVPELRASNHGERQARNEQAQDTPRAPSASRAKPRTVVLEPLELERIDDDGGSPIALHGTARLFEGLRHEATAMPVANLSERPAGRCAL